MGPSNSGKSTAVLTALKSVDSKLTRRGVVYLSLREISTSELAEKLGEGVGYTKEEGMSAAYNLQLYLQHLGRETRLQHVLDVTKRALEEMRKEGKNRPVFGIDDVHKSFKNGSFPPEIEDLLSWTLEMHTKGLLLFKMLLHETCIVPHIQTGEY